MIRFDDDPLTGPQDDSLDDVEDETRTWHFGPGKRMWTARWQEMIDHKRQVDSAYRGTTAPSVDEFRMAIDGFFVACEHLKDWLIHDLRFSVTGQNDHLAPDAKNEKRRSKLVRDFADQTLALRVADAYANTWKHHSRIRPGKDDPYAWIDTVTSHRAGMTAEIWLKEPNKLVPWPPRFARFRWHEITSM